MNAFEELKQYNTLTLVAVIFKRLEAEKELKDPTLGVADMPTRLESNPQIPMQTILPTQTNTFVGQPATPATKMSYNIICSNCGKQSTVPFKPNPNKPVHCKICYDALRG